jgi:hypothetical protein
MMIFQTSVKTAIELGSNALTIVQTKGDESKNCKTMNVISFDRSEIKKFISCILQESGIDISELTEIPGNSRKAAGE